MENAKHGQPPRARTEGGLAMRLPEELDVVEVGDLAAGRVVTLLQAALLSYIIFIMLCRLDIDWESPKHILL
jgi:hypothetical protein